ncbi:HAMP domain-containing protein [Iocasia frigidifontis]|uniref:histidine kinase n=1 Tax=Iocasia fonsfrigidae TaxID=2682810 RepID=A0A8A7KIR3_9FIRM|nr:ATP-binding protein [Iocasia fonsfrigidae]QTL99479.1 HAMP domain-containing protein [Iocasia fonsfrigidae]
MLKFNNLSLRKQFILLFLAIQVVLLLIVMLYFNYSERDFYLSQLKENLESEAVLIINNQKANIMAQKAVEIDAWVKEIGSRIDKRITIIDLRGRVIGDSNYDPGEMDNHLNRPEIQKIINGEGTGSAIRKSDTLNIDMLYTAVPIYQEDDIIGFIRISKSLQAINAIIYTNIINNLIFFILMLFLTLILIWKFTRDIVNPLGQITELASKLADGNFRERIRLKNYQNEIGTLARVFNNMAAQLDNKINQISREKNRAEAILTNMVDGLIAVDSNMKLTIINPAARIMFSIEGDVRGKNIIEIFRHHEIDQTLEKSLNSNEIISQEIVIQKDEKKIYDCNFVPISNEEGFVIGGIIVFSDITELRKLEQHRKEFVGNVSHELKTPLTSIIGYVDTILDNDIKDHRIINKFLKIIKAETDRLFLLIKDLLDLSKLEAKKSYILRAAILNKIIDKTVLVLSEKAEDKEIELIKDVPKLLPLVYMIPEQIEQVFINLIDNSIKYTPDQGKVIVRAYEGDGKVIVEIEDNGFGIPEKEQERIFERFYRVDKARSRSMGGTGIGLSIVKHIIYNHNSEIEVESQPGQGSLFRFYLDIVK